MSRRQQRVEELLRRELAQMLMRGELRDPRLSPSSAVGITGVVVSGDLSVARVYVDVLAESLRIDDVLEAFASGAGVLRHKLGERLRLRRMPELRFMHDESIGRGARIEEILIELREQAASDAAEPASSDDAEPASEPDGSGTSTDE